MSQLGFPNRWYLELEGRRMGPFSPEQILGLLADGEIPENLHVSPDPTLAERYGFSGSMTASAMREVYFSDSRIPTAAQPSLNEKYENHENRDPPDAPPVESDADQDLATARRLFDLFQTAREKRAARFAPSVQNAGPKSSVVLGDRRIIAAAAALIVVGISVWGVSRKEAGVEREIAQVQAVATQTPGVASLPSADARPKSVPATQPKPVVRNAWKPGKTVAKITPPARPTRDRREDERRDDRDEDRRDDLRADSWDDREGESDVERAQAGSAGRRGKSKSKARDRADQDRDLENDPDQDSDRQTASAPDGPAGLLNQMATDTGLQQGGPGSPEDSP